MMRSAFVVFTTTPRPPRGLQSKSDAASLPFSAVPKFAALTRADRVGPHRAERTSLQEEVQVPHVLALTVHRHHQHPGHPPLMHGAVVPLGLHRPGAAVCHAAVPTAVHGAEGLSSGQRRLP
eukprot:CAMPEP_0118927662 /NCGR_PEP_ID=MMETSP1169-20130426/5090_1 /TAXON_ID=36882 /ORGANISM="Pyramimonas obovata, Strain CCMP722" /LENGTH=121 /DNA_ID=CAMNT_0006869471 /DNA_START=329 /DNA_END=691 /DNA_ORIENTATION=-